jgi:AcrR family transcriptional regulator
MTQAEVPGRTYGGVSPGQRQADRRARLIEAAIQVYGEVGFKNASVKAVCQTAGLTERYFYEAFANSEAMLIATYDDVNTHFVQTIREAGNAAPHDRESAMMTAYLLGLKKQPREAHLFLVEVRGVSPAVDAVITTWVDRFGAMIAETLHAPDPDRLLIRGTVGGLLHLATAWIETGYDAPIEHVVRQCLVLCTGLRGDGRGP